MLNRIISQNAPNAVGPYVHAVDTGTLVFFSGQIGLDKDTNTLKSGIVEQTHQVLTNIKALLNDQGLDFCNVVKTSIFVTDLSEFKTVNEIYASYFDNNYPARSCVEVSKLPMNALVEIEVIACKNGSLSTGVGEE